MQRSGMTRLGPVAYDRNAAMLTLGPRLHSVRVCQVTPVAYPIKISDFGLVEWITICSISVSVLDVKQSRLVESIGTE
jgi:hypothetical protein